MLRQRVISGCAIAALLLLLPLFAPLIGIWLFLAVLSALGQLEFYRLMADSGMPVFRLLGVAIGWLLLAASFSSAGHGHTAGCSDETWLVLALTAGVIAVFLRQFPQRNNSQPLQTMGCTLLGVLYVPYLMAYLVRLAADGEGTSWKAPIGSANYLVLFYLIIVVKATDMGAYFAGMALGRHKLIPRISPGKTWEGFAGGIAAGIATSLIFAGAGGWKLGVILMPWPHAAALGCVLALAAVAGDLFESLLKRAAGAKDSSRLLPGMGGLLDVTDSILFGAPVLYYWIRLMGS